jgi:1-pyrroline-5-carboxylate dehydrogenase
MDLFKEAGLPDGVINMVTVPGRVAGEVCFKHPELGVPMRDGGSFAFLRQASE